MPVSVRDARSSQRDRQWMVSVYHEYLTDLLPDGTGRFPTLSEVGHSKSDQLASWFADSSAQILVILHESQPVGFALVRTQPSGAAPQGGSIHYMSEFFIARAFRRRGFGLAAVRLILDRYAGDWHIMEYQRNGAAVAFWRSAVRSYTGGRYQERAANGEVHQYFASRNRV